MSELNKKYEIVFKDKKQETSEIFSFVFDKPDNLRWLPGQHGIFRFPKFDFQHDKGYRVFSFTSVEEDEIVMFSTCIKDSDSSEFKSHLMRLQEGDVMTVEDPQGRFTITSFEKPICILTRGIGITPVRSILRHLELSGVNPARMKVYYLDEKFEYAFKDNLELIDKKIKGLEIEFLGDMGVLKDRIESFARIFGNEAMYYTSGTPSINGMLIETLFILDIDKTNMKADNFIGC
jgi:ferredoxin-NADP reductase